MVTEQQAFVQFTKRVRRRALLLLVCRAAAQSLAVGGGLALLLTIVPSFGIPLAGMRLILGGMAVLWVAWVVWHERPRAHDFVPVVDEYYDAAGRVVAAADFLTGTEPLDAFRVLALKEAGRWVNERKHLGLPWRWPTKWKRMALCVCWTAIILAGCAQPHPPPSEPPTKVKLDVAPPGHGQPTVNPASSTPSEVPGSHDRTAGKRNREVEEEGTDGRSSQRPAASDGRSSQEQPGQSANPQGAQSGGGREADGAEGDTGRSGSDARPSADEGSGSSHPAGVGSETEAELDSGSSSADQQFGSGTPSGEQPGEAAPLTKSGTADSKSPPMPESTGRPEKEQHEVESLKAGNQPAEKRFDDQSVRSPKKAVSTPSRDHKKTKSDSHPTKKVTGRGQGEDFADGSAAAASPAPSVSYENARPDDMLMASLPPAERKLVERYLANLQRLARSKAEQGRPPTTQPTRQPTTRPEDP
jgi:hypothetical protein